MSLRYLKILKDISFVFGFLGFFLTLFERNTYINEVIFLWILSSTILSYYLKERKKFPFLITLILLPLFLLKNLFDILFILLLFIFILRSFFIKEFSMKYGVLEEEFRKTLFLMASIMILSFILSFVFKLPLNSLNVLVIPFWILTLLSSVILLRTLRFLEYNKENKEIERINIRDSLIVFLLAFILGSPSVRSLLFKLLYYLYLGIGYVVIFLALIFLIPIGFILQKVILFLAKILSEKGIYTVKSKNFLSNFNFQNTMKIWDFKEKNNIFSILENKTTILILGIFLIFLFFFILLRIFKDLKSQGERVKEDYIEEREFILPTLKNNLLKRFFIPVTDKDRIREYYRRYLRISKERGVDIKESDTSLDIYQKTRNIFDKETLKRMREIYIKVRYSSISLEKRIVKEFIELYKKAIR